MQITKTKNKILGTGEFYNKIAPKYSGLTNKSYKKKKKLLSQFIKPNSKTAADIGCGIGNDSIILDSYGLKVTGFDISEEMINLAKLNANTNNLIITFIRESSAKISEKYFGRFDFILSIGNTFANLSTYDLNRTIEKMYNMLDDGGTILVHILNYELITNQDNRIVNITEDDKRTYVRFYDFEKNFWNFNIMHYSNKNKNDREIISTKIYPHFPNNIITKIENAGFKKIQTFEDLEKNKFDIETSKDLFILAEK